MCNIEKEHVLMLVEVIIVAVLLAIAFVHAIKPNDSEQSTSNTEVIRQELQDSIKVINAKENEEITIVRNASNDSTLVIFKKLVSD